MSSGRWNRPLEGTEKGSACVRKVTGFMKTPFKNLTRMTQMRLLFASQQSMLFVQSLSRPSAIFQLRCNFRSPQRPFARDRLNGHGWGGGSFPPG
jgi:hypothetical protein